MIFSAIWTVVKTFIDEKTRQKISICGSSYKKDLLKFVDEENLPDFLGGTCKCPEGCAHSNAGPWQKYPIEELEKENKKSGFDQDEEIMQEEEK